MALEPNNIRARTASLDDIDRRLLTLLQADARASNSALASEVGIAASTCHGRIRRLIELGVVRGFFADIDPAAVGRPLRAMVAVSLQSDARGQIRRFVAEIGQKDDVIDVFFLAGADDYLLHVATADTESLRQFVEMLNSRPEVSGTTTSLVFDHLRGSAPVF
ncbi:MAG: Lrp/AsnC family transcriptional regulator [Gordonia sp.]|jgi:DNA-binding Lrp family transcriptional regulator|uniref:Lrp/AsnC family transcriptional regulator n=1 Tax=Gordonia rubripertincta TaxID=36822 RepID=A0ABT4MTR8_GORRU|nr:MULTISPECIES: Lrp/AsnC family transcriptional regulator [Mycobacteriales]MBA4025186.1 Lrp/AsnC family transcriptional regulator [Gordonia sp. (in: high G+C Gram-positive bacteria)]MCZ4550398.1 Lrp/AsnC family transcriptional regulator [Gordonia rubripertincta]OZG26727.1 AsnC family transcriptional regulator [Williamsia sp. 1138]